MYLSCSATESVLPFPPYQEACPSLCGRGDAAGTVDGSIGVGLRASRIGSRFGRYKISIGVLPQCFTPCIFRVACFRYSVMHKPAPSENRAAGLSHDTAMVSHGAVLLYTSLRLAYIRVFFAFVHVQPVVVRSYHYKLVLLVWSRVQFICVAGFQVVSAFFSCATTSQHASSTCVVGSL